MGMRLRSPRWEPLFALALSTFALLSTVALLVGCWVEGAFLLVCTALAGVAVSRDLVLFVAGCCLLFAVLWHLSFWLFGPGRGCPGGAC